MLTLKPRWRPVIDKLYGGVREARLTTAVDVLAIVAYRQPITKAETDNFRARIPRPLRQLCAA